jgi:hypothetical protein
MFYYSLGVNFYDLLRLVGSIRTRPTYKMNHRVVESNGIKMHLAEDGEGPLVVLCHGWPELWYSWRNQLKALLGGNYAGLDKEGSGAGRRTLDPAGAPK